MAFADKKRMPIDERKVKEMLRHQNEFRAKIEKEIPNNEEFKRHKQFEYGVLTYVAEAAHGEMKDLLNEVHVRKELLPFQNYAELKRARADTMIHPGDSQMKYLLNALFTPVDMTDYEDAFSGWNEFQGEVPISRSNWIQRWNKEQAPQTDALPNLSKQRESWNPATGPTMQAAIIDKYTEVDPEEYEFYGQEDDEDEDYDEEGDEEEDEYGDYGDYDEEVEDPFDA